MTTATTATRGTNTSSWGRSAASRPRALAAGLLAGLVAVLAAPLAGCAGSQHPVSTAQEATADRALFGAWQGEVLDKPHLFVVGRPPSQSPLTEGVSLPGGLLNIVVVGIDDPADAHEVEAMNIPAVATVFAAADDAGARHWGVLSIPDLDDEAAFLTPARWHTAGVESWLLLRYEIDGEALRISPLSTSKVRAAIEAGTLTGRTGKEGGRLVAAGPVITSSPAEIRAFLAGGGDLFEGGEVAVLRRVAPAGPVRAAPASP